MNAIENNQDVKNQLGGEVNIDKMPTEFYTTDDYSVVMVLQQDVDTIHSAGTVYVPVGNLRDRQNDVTKKIELCEFDYVCIVTDCLIVKEPLLWGRFFFCIIDLIVVLSYILMGIQQKPCKNTAFEFI